MHLSDIREQLTKNGYLPSNEIVMAAYGALHGVPLLVESDPCLLYTSPSPRDCS
mgnify:CR=1 FL=1